MLIEFSVKNYRSIKDVQTLSLVKAKGKELEDSNSFTPDAPASVPLLRSAVIYGPNAAGKSNLIRAMAAMEEIVRESATGYQEGDDLQPIEPYRFDDVSENNPTEFEATFIAEGVRYQYGFSATRQRILEEWLFAYPKGRPQNWFSREYDEESNHVDYKFGAFLQGKKSVWQGATRDNALFLSVAVQFNSDKLRPVFNWFKEGLIYILGGGLPVGYTAKMCDEEKGKDRVLSFLKVADFDVDDIKVDKKAIDRDSLPEGMPEPDKDRLLKSLKGQQLVRVGFSHTVAGKSVYLDLHEESEGTQRFFQLAKPFIQALDEGQILVVDELNSSLHSKLLEYLISLFHNKETNPHNAQLVFTTHDTSVLSPQVFRRDQVWFCEKNKGQATDLYPLLDFNPLKERENFGARYMGGRYGALPFTQEYTLYGES